MEEDTCGLHTMHTPVYTCPYVAYTDHIQIIEVKFLLTT